MNVHSSCSEQVSSLLEMHCTGPHQNYLPCPWGMGVTLCWLFQVRAVIRKVSFLCDLSVFGIDVQIFNKAGGCSEFRAELSAGGPDGTHCSSLLCGQRPTQSLPAVSFSQLFPGWLHYGEKLSGQVLICPSSEASGKAAGWVLSPSECV